MEYDYTKTQCVMYKLSLDYPKKFYILTSFQKRTFTQITPHHQTITTLIKMCFHELWQHLKVLMTQSFCRACRGSIWESTKVTLGWKERGGWDDHWETAVRNWDRLSQQNCMQTSDNSTNKGFFRWKERLQHYLQLLVNYSYATKPYSCWFVITSKSE